MLTYILASVITFGFTTILTIAGLGAAFILIPIFNALGIPLLVAMSTALLLNSIAMSIASINYAKAGFVIYRIAIPILILASFFSPIGAITATYLNKKLLLLFFALFLTFAGSMMLFYKPKAKTKVLAEKKKIFFCGSLIGILAGFVGGLLGVGGGNLIVPALVWLGLEPKKASATASFIVVFSSFSGFLGHVSTGHIDSYLLLFCTFGSVSGALLGSYLMKYKLSSSQVRKTIGIVLYLIAAKIILSLLK